MVGAPTSATAAEAALCVLASVAAVEPNPFHVLNATLSAAPMPTSATRVAPPPSRAQMELPACETEPQPGGWPNSLAYHWWPAGRVRLYK